MKIPTRGVSRISSPPTLSIPCHDPPETPCNPPRRVVRTGLVGSTGIDPHDPLEFLRVTPTFFPAYTDFLFGVPKMVYQKRKFTFEVDELTHMKLSSLFGKSNYKENDFTKLTRLMIDSSYSNSKGKKAKGL